MAELAIIDHHDPEKGVWLFRNPNAPKIQGRTQAEEESINGYWQAVINLADFVLEMQRDIPGWLPEYKIIGL